MCHVLIIEDECLVAMALESCLAAHGATSFAIAQTQADAVAAALAIRPALITSDVRLSAGTGPAAVAQIVEALGPIPVIFVTASPEECVPCEPPARIFSKPVNEGHLAAAFRDMAPV